MILRCYSCGKEVEIDHVESNDKRLYIEIQSKLLFRVKYPEYLCIICMDCVNYLGIK